MPGYAHNDETGKVFCHLCDWTMECGQNMERIEFEVFKHLKEKHGLEWTGRFREEYTTKKRTHIPDE